jgi:hypothetical protein
MNAASLITPAETAHAPTAMPGRSPIHQPRARAARLAAMRTSVPAVITRELPWRMRRPCWKRRYAIDQVQGSINWKPRRPGSITSGGAPITDVASQSKSGEKATSACSAVSEAPARSMKLRTRS